MPPVCLQRKFRITIAKPYRARRGAENGVRAAFVLWGHDRRGSVKIVEDLQNGPLPCDFFACYSNGKRTIGAAITP